MARLTSSGLQVNLLGAEQVRAVLKSMEGNNGKNIVRQALKKGSRITLLHILPETPIDTGKLVGSIRERSGRTQKGTLKRIIVTGEGFFRGETFYGGFVHFGHGVGKRSKEVKRAQKKRNKALLEQIDTRKQVPADPWMQRGAERSEARSQAAMTAHIRDGIRKFWDREARKAKRALRRASA